MIEEEWEGRGRMRWREGGRKVERGMRRGKEMRNGKRGEGWEREMVEEECEGKQEEKGRWKGRVWRKERGGRKR